MLLELGLLYGFGVANTPYLPKKDFQRPYLLVELPLYQYDYGILYSKILNSARTNAKKLNEMNPKTGLWDISIGFKSNNGIDLQIGHQSEHEIGEIDKFSESFDYIKLSYKIEYK